MKSVNLLLFIFILGFVSCKKEKDESNSLEALLTRFLIRSFLTSSINSELPSNLSVAVPRSIRKSNQDVNTSILSLQVIPFPPTFSFAQDTLDSGFTGQSFLQEGTDIVAEILQESKRDLILISGAFNEAKASQGVCIPGGLKTVRISLDMESEFIEGMRRLGLSETEARSEVISLQNQGILPSIGEAVPTPAMVYKELTSGEYDIEISYSFSESIGTPLACPSNSKFQKTIKFKRDKSKISSSISKSLKLFGVSLDISASIIYTTLDGKKDKAILNIKKATSAGKGDKSQSTTRFTFEECSNDSEDNLGNCVTLSYNAVDDINGQKITTKVEGRSDDNGGYVKTNYFDDYNEEEYVLQETYNANREITFLEVTYNDYFNSTSDYDYIGYLDYDLYGSYYESSYSFEGEVFVEFAVAPPGQQIGTGGFTAYDAFVLMPNGINPNIFPDEYIGWGEFDGTDYYIDFYGTEDDVPGLQVWRYHFDASGNEIYTQLLSESIILAP
ncbi:hypothetical protein P3G55_00410 [Leptospira sp. 96542]|nr:hypothetical protein [Leptospira sp. 96542]